MDPLGTTFETIGPGQTVQHQFTLSQANFGGSGTPENLTGSFAVEVYDVPAAPGEFTADFQIAASASGAIISSVTTNQPVYQAGETVTMTFTETNTSDQAVMVLTGQNGFIFDQVLPASYSGIPLLPGPTTTGWSTLEPGQSWTQTETWPVIDPVSGSYTVKISNFFDSNANTSTFEVAGESTSGNLPASGNLPVTTNHSVYTLGENVRVTVMIPGTKREQRSLVSGTDHRPRRHPGSFPANPPHSASRLKQLKAGHSVTLTTVWNGRPNSTRSTLSSPGPTPSTSTTAIRAAARPSPSAE